MGESIRFIRQDHFTSSGKMVATGDNMTPLENKKGWGQYFPVLYFCGVKEICTFAKHDG